MTEMRVTSFWYTCFSCKREISVTQSNPLDLYEVIHCYVCGKVQRVMEFKGEPEIFTKEIKKDSV